MLKVSFLPLTALLAVPAGHAAPPLHDGYAIVSEAPVATDLAQTVYLNVRGRTLLEGLLEILRGTGYRLASKAAADPEIGRLYAQPYPEHQRAMGPIELGSALERLAGPAWQVVEDPVNRLVSFEVRTSYPPGPTAGADGAARRAKPGDQDAVAGGPTVSGRGGER